MDCQACGHPNPDDARYCGDCGQPLAREVHCGECGASAAPGQKFCTSCGTPLAAAAVITAGPRKREPSNPDLRDELARYARDVRREHGLTFSVRMGINSGEVVVGAVGDDLNVDYTAIGHTVGLASRMEQLAEPGKAFLTGATASLVEGWFDLTDLGDFDVKGVAGADPPPPPAGARAAPPPPPPRPAAAGGAARPPAPRTPAPARP